MLEMVYRLCHNSYQGNAPQIMYFRGCEESERVLESDIGFANQVKVHLSVNELKSTGNILKRHAASSIPCDVTAPRRVYKSTRDGGRRSVWRDTHCKKYE
ncbi:hypothetical protein CBL_14410 [Carabus blaptoides fortunei]